MGLFLYSAKGQEADKGTQTELEDPAFRVVKSPDGEDYFPKGKESYYTKYYRAANLPSMLTKREPKGHVRFRLAILPSFTKPLFLTYSRDAKGTTIRITRVSLRSVDNRLELGGIELTGEVAIGDRLAKRFEEDAIDPSIRRPLRQYSGSSVSYCNRWTDAHGYLKFLLTRTTPLKMFPAPNGWAMLIQKL